MNFNKECAVKNAVNLLYNLTNIDDESFVEKIVMCVNDNDVDTLNQILESEVKRYES